MRSRQPIVWMLPACLPAYRLRSPLAKVCVFLLRLPVLQTAAASRASTSLAAGPAALACCSTGACLRSLPRVLLAADGGGSTTLLLVLLLLLLLLVALRRCLSFGPLPRWWCCCRFCAYSSSLLACLCMVAPSASSTFPPFLTIASPSRGARSTGARSSSTRRDDGVSRRVERASEQRTARAQLLSESPRESRRARGALQDETTTNVLSQTRELPIVVARSLAPWLLPGASIPTTIHE